MCFFRSFTWFWPVSPRAPKNTQPTTKNTQPTTKNANQSKKATKNTAPSAQKNTTKAQKKAAEVVLFPTYFQVRLYLGFSCFDLNSNFWDFMWCLNFWRLLGLELFGTLCLHNPWRHNPWKAICGAAHPLTKPWACWSRQNACRMTQTSYKRWFRITLHKSF